MAKKVEKPRPEFTKRQLSRRQQQKRRQRIIFGAAILIILAVLGVVGAGVYNRWYLAEYKPMHETVIEVNDTKFNMDYYIRTLKCYCSLQGLDIQYAQLITDGVISAIEQSELARQEAAKLGITVNDEEVDEALNSQNPPLSKDYRDIVRTQLLTQKMNSEYFDKQVPTYAAQRHIWAMFLESESQANEVRARLEAGEDFAKLAGELSLDTTTKDKKGDLGWRPEGALSLLIVSSVLDENAFSCEVGVLSQPICEETKTKTVGYWLIEVLSRDVEAKTASVNVMLLGSESQANEVRARLEAGEDFATLAKELSQHDASKENGGSFEVTSGSTVSSAFDAFVFDPKVEVETLSQPIRDDEMSTTGGCWLIKVTETDDNRQIDEENRNLFKSDALTKWISGLLDNPENKVTSYLDDAKKQWAVMHITGG